MTNKAKINKLHWSTKKQVRVGGIGQAKNRSGMEQVRDGTGQGWNRS